MIKFAIDGIADGILHGWFWNEADEGRRRVHLSIDGILVDEIDASSFRADLRDAHVGDAHHAFQYRLPPKWLDGLPHSFALLTLQDGSRIIHGSRLLTPNAQSCSVELMIDRVSYGAVYGWACERQRPDRRFTIFALVDGKIVGTAIADQRREDLAAAEIGDGRYGFKLVLAHELVVAKEDTTIDFTVDEPSINEFSVSILLPPEPRYAPLRLDVRSGNQDETVGATLDEDTRTGILPKYVKSTLRSVDNANLFLDSEHPLDAAECSIAASPEGPTISCRSPRGWVRVLQPLQRPAILLSMDWLIELSFATGTAFIYDLHIVELTAANLFRVVLEITRGIKAEASIHRYDLIVGARRLRAADFDRLGKGVFLAVTVFGDFSFERFQIKIAPQAVKEQLIPYRFSEDAHVLGLVEVNDSLKASGINDLDAWALRMAEAAITLECFLTASKLVSQLVGDELPTAAHQKKFLLICTEVFFAEDRLDELRCLLMENSSVTTRDDQLFMALSYCFPQDDRFSSFFARLPSGLPNRAFLARCGLNSSAALQTLLLPKMAYDDGQTELLFANFLKNKTAASYLKRWNSYLKRYSLAELVSVDVAAANVMQTFRFCDVPTFDSDEAKVSIIMSAYNASDTIAYAIRSIFAQSYKNFELLICDDESTDNTVDVIKSFQGHPSVRLFRSMRNQGPYNIRNALILQSTGRFVTFQDADDLAHPERLARQVAEIQRIGGRASLAQWVRMRPNGDVIFFRDNMCLQTSLVSLMLDRQLFDELGKFRSVLCGADTEFYLRLRMRLGYLEWSELQIPLIFGLWSKKSLTQQPGLEVTEFGYRSPSRWSYAEHSTRHTLLGPDLVPSEEIDSANRELGLYIAPSGVLPLE